MIEGIVSLLQSHFVFPLILAAGGAAAVPVIIHLTMRTKPRRMTFPAMRFVRKTHRASLSKLRLKHLLLLLLRMAAILLLALLIAQARIPQWTTAPDPTTPAAVVFVVDNSGSMGYRHRGQAVLARGKRFAQQVIDSLPKGSRAAVLPTDGVAEKPALQVDLKAVGRQLAGVQASYGTRPVGPAIGRAVRLLADAKLARKEVYVVSDMTRQGWRDLTAVGSKEIRFFVLDCGSGEDANVSLGEVRLDTLSVPVGAEVPVEVVLRSTRIGGEFDVRLEVNGEPADSRAVTLRGGSTAVATLAFTPRSRGVVHGRVSFQQDDPLEMDNARYFTLHVGPQVQVLIVRDPTTVGRGARTSFLMGHAIAPGGSGPGRGGWLRRQTITADRLDAAQLTPAQIVLLADVASLSDQQWQDLARFVRAGGHVWVVIGSLVDPASYNSAAAQQVLPAAMGPMEVLGEPVGWQAGRRSEPVLQPFTTPANPALSAVRCRRRMRLSGIAPDAHVILRYADGKAAIVTRSVGAGSAVLWNFSPVRGYSNLAGLAQFPILARRTARLLGGGVGEQTMFFWGGIATVAIPRSMPTAVMTVRRPGSASDEPVVTPLRRRVLDFRADRLGHWTVQFSEAGRRIGRGFSVNADFAESNLAPADPEKLAGLFPPGSLAIASDMAHLAEHRARVTRPLHLAVPILLAVVVLILGESFFANRFYRREPLPEEAG